jgi:RNA polymerase sigma-70 factor (ECF subfamily)
MGKKSKIILSEERQAEYLQYVLDKLLHQTVLDKENIEVILPWNMKYVNVFANFGGIDHDLHNPARDLSGGMAYQFWEMMENIYGLSEDDVEKIWKIYGPTLAQRMEDAWLDDWRNDSLLRESFTSADMGKIYNELWDEMLHSVCMKYTNDINTAQDYCQNGFVKVYQNIHKKTRDGSLKGWIRRVINNNILDELRKKKIKYTTDDSMLGRVEDPTSTEDQYVEKISTIEIMRAAENLSPAFKKVFELYFEGYKHEEIAEKLGITVGTSKSNLFKAKANLRKYLGGMVNEAKATIYPHLNKEEREDLYSFAWHPEPKKRKFYEAVLRDVVNASVIGWNGVIYVGDPVISHKKGLEFHNIYLAYDVTPFLRYLKDTYGLLDKETHPIWSRWENIMVEKTKKWLKDKDISWNDGDYAIGVDYTDDHIWDGNEGIPQ